MNNNFYLQKLKFNRISKNYFRWFSDEYVMRFINAKYKSKNDLLNSIKIELKKDNQIIFGIFSKKNRHIGNIKFHDIDLENKNLWLGILIGEKLYRKKKIGSEVIKVLSDFFFKKFGIEKFYLRVSKKNLNAIKSYRKAGFQIMNSSSGNYVMVLNKKLNKLILGTAQFGDTYGILNYGKKKLSRLVKNKILLKAKNRINIIDTAEDYNIDLQTKKNFKNFEVNTKVNFDLFTKSHKNIEIYLKKINRFYRINVLFIRNLENNFDKTKIIKKIIYYQKKKLINKIGISIYDFKNLNKTYKKIKFDVVQIPLNIFDNRADKYQNFFSKNNIEVHARSIYLQGLFFSNKKIIHSQFKRFKENILSLQKKANFKSKIITIFALSHVLNKDYISKIIIGIDNYKQLDHILNFKIISNTDFLKKFNISNDYLIDPRKWKNS